jgi:hypothetical protein
MEEENILTKKNNNPKIKSEQKIFFIFCLCKKYKTR